MVATLAVLATLCGSAAGGLGIAPGDRAAAAPAPAPAAPTVTFSEDFENGNLSTATSILNYVSAPQGSGANGPVPYSADPPTGPGSNSNTYDSSTGDMPGWVPSPYLDQTACNGWITNYNTVTPASGFDPTCRGRYATTNPVWTNSWPYLRALAEVMGQAEGQGPTNSNHILSAFTDNPFANHQNAGVQFTTPNNAITVIPGHYYVGSVWYGAVNCQAQHPIVQFNMITAATTTTLGGTTDACTSGQAAGYVSATGSGPGVYNNVGTATPTSATSYSPNTTTSTVTGIVVPDNSGDSSQKQVVIPQSNTITDGGGLTVARIYSDAVAIPAGTTRVGLQMLNTNATGRGNDGGFDVPQLVDATPTISKTFSPNLVQLGTASTLTFTITNTSELSGKNDFAFTDTLPAGLTVASGAIGGSCTQTAGTAPFSVTAPQGAGTIVAVGGDLAKGQSSCTITVPVIGAAVGSYTNTPTGNISPSVGLLMGTGDTLRVVQPQLTLTKQLTAARQSSGGHSNDQFTVAIRTGSASGPLLGIQPNATTQGSGATVTSGTGTTGQQPALAGTDYYLSETAAGTSDLSLYTAYLTCNDSTGTATGLPNNVLLGSGGYVLRISSITANVNCVITNTPTPYLNIAKTFNNASVNASTGSGTASYTVTVANSSAGSGSYGALVDTPGFGTGLTVTGASWSSSTGSSGSATGPGPFTLAPAGTAIAANATQTFNVTIAYGYTGNQVPGACTGRPGSGLYNAVSLPAGQEQGSTSDNAACGPVYGLQLAKTDQQGNPLAGSKWQLTADSNGSPGPAPVNAITPQSSPAGTFALTGLPPGTYWLTETTAPRGYALGAQALQFVIAADGTVTAGSSPNSGTGSITKTSDGRYQITAADVRALSLPFLGGSGPVAWTVAGLAVVAFAGGIGIALAVARSRTRSSE